VTAPVEHVEDSLKLTGDRRVDLWELRLKTSATIYRFWNGVTRTWQGQIWEGHACTLSAESRNSDGQQSRPVLTLINPTNIFGQLAAEGTFDMATLVRKRVLQDHFLNNINIAHQSVYITTRVVAVNDQALRLELRSPTDIPTFKTPRRTYDPPEYPFVVF